MLRTVNVFRWALLAVMLVASGCSIYGVPGQEPAPVELPKEHTEVSPPATPAPRPPAGTAGTVPRDNLDAAYGPLLLRAQGATNKGDYEQALMLLERAQRIDPDSAAVYLALAQTHSARGDRRQAQASAERGLLYCSDPAQCAELRAYLRR